MIGLHCGVKKKFKNQFILKKFGTQLITDYRTGAIITPS